MLLYLNIIVQKYEVVIKEFVEITREQLYQDIQSVVSKRVLASGLPHLNLLEYSS